MDKKQCPQIVDDRFQQSLASDCDGNKFKFRYQINPAMTSKLLLDTLHLPYSERRSEGCGSRLYLNIVKDNRQKERGKGRELVKSNDPITSNHDDLWKTNHGGPLLVECMVGLDVFITFTVSHASGPP